MRSDLKYAPFGAINPATGAGGALTGGAYQFSSYSRSIDANVQGPVHAFATHDLLFGVTYANSSSGQMSAQLQGNVVGTPVNVYRWNPSSVPEPDVGPYQQSQQNDISQKGVYGRPHQARGTRHARARRAAELVEPGQPRRALQHRPPVHAVRRADLGFRARLVVVRELCGSVPAANQVDVGRRHPDAGEGRTYETGVKGELAGGKLNVSLAAFRIDLDNNPQVDLAHPCAGRTATT